MLELTGEHHRHRIRKHYEHQYHYQAANIRQHLCAIIPNVIEHRSNNQAEHYVTQ